MQNFLEKIKARKSLVCVGLDPVMDKIPKRFNSIFEFNKYIIDQTKDFVAVYKPNLAFYEQYGRSGLQALYETIDYIPKNIGVIVDAKRGDIGNTAEAYAKAIFDDLKADATTLAPYMGADSIEPFLKRKDKFSYVLCLTSNPGAADFEKPELYKKVAGKIAGWNNQYQNCGAVVGATNPKELNELRVLMPEVNFLIPGIGAQGGDLENTIASVKSNFLINSSRNIIFAENPAAAAEELQKAINNALK